MKKFEYAGKRYMIAQHDDGSFALSEDVSPTPVLAVGTWDEIMKHVKTTIGNPMTWIS